jgi:hypothetical protein
MNNNKNSKCYHSLEYNDQSNKIWYNNYGGYIIKNWIEPGTNLIKQEKIPYNQPNNFIKFLDNYFMNKLN